MNFITHPRLTSIRESISSNKWFDLPLEQKKQDLQEIDNHLKYLAENLKHWEGLRTSLAAYIENAERIRSHTSEHSH